MRITKTSSRGSNITRGKPIEVIINQVKVVAYEGELVSTVLHAQGIRPFNRKHKTGRPSGVYCGMGVCYECLVTLNGVSNIRACQTFVEDMMIIETSNEENT